ncbi:pullulanase [Mycobacterium sp. MYCO198283]|uniref:pullulanase n=1 Tax=Mycobacterium sp. MYCO198283 TaxID=2883505 RepID=UPI001E4D9AF6|nr:pullulanase [Mycobacterium sp. MYCO198283]MCG5434129.1 pullulanase [Mycobacterium sp. MYCO198283]
MEYCLGGDDGVSVLAGTPDLDVDRNGVLDAVRLDLDHDGRIDDALADLDGDGLADHAVLDVDDTGPPEVFFTDDGSGTWSVAVDRGGRLRWFSLDGAEQTGGPVVDFDGDGETDDTLVDSDADGLADRVLCADPGGTTGYVDTDADGAMDLRLVDRDGDGAADDASAVGSG